MKTNLIHVVSSNVNSFPEKLAFAFLKDGESILSEVTFKQLDKRIKKIAGYLQKNGCSDERTLLIFENGLDYVQTFLACIYAKAIAVPLHPIGKNKPVSRIASIAKDSEAKFILSTREHYDEIKGHLQEDSFLRKLEWVLVDEINENFTWKCPVVSENSLAFLQYTSGSTGTPKGVMVSHRHMLHYIENTVETYQLHEEDVMVSWVPIHHDLGLIFGIMLPVVKGISCYLMTPTDFVQNPVRWLNALSNYGGTITSGPNFAYELCAVKVTSEEKKKIDMKAVKVMMNAAEPVRKDTLLNFTKAFSECGFTLDKFNPGWGLAEATLIVSTTPAFQQPGFIYVLERDLKKGKVTVVQEDSKERTTSFVGHSFPINGNTVEIVNPETCEKAALSEIGEIWIKGELVTSGYWKRETLSENEFRAKIKGDTSDNTYLRSGDLGFIHKKELVITGRHKDLIIIRGQNYYPQDIERIVDHAHPSLRKGCAAAFSIEKNNSEKLVVIQELRSEKTEKAIIEKIIKYVRKEVFDAFGIAPFELLFIQPRTISKTSSGKIQRKKCKQTYLKNEFDLIYRWNSKTGMENLVFAASKAFTGIGKRESLLLIREELKRVVASTLNIPVSSLQVDEPLSFYGMDSIKAVEIANQVAKKYGLMNYKHLVYDFPTIMQVADFVLDERETNTESGEGSGSTDIQVAVVGIACRFPKANNPEEFYDLLLKGQTGISAIPEARKPYYALGDENKKPERCGWIDSIYDFDYSAFNISKVEAANMDPHQRLVLKVVWEALENAGIKHSTIYGKSVGVFIGACNNDFDKLRVKHGATSTGHSGTASASSIIANRVSYFFNLKGPSLTIDTACSSSLTAFHLAVESVRNNDSAIAITGGVNLILDSGTTEDYRNAGMLSPDFECKTFDDKANGYVRGEGCGITILTSVKNAQKQGYCIQATVAATAINQDGKSNGITAPNGPSQQRVIEKALKKAKLTVHEIDYIETHGTGTKLGDPIEYHSLKKVFQNRKTPLMLGAVKTNVGHLEAAAGIAGVIKGILTLKHQKIPANRNLIIPNSFIAFSDKLIPLTSPAEFPRVAGSRRTVGISSFGFGGTNVHALLQDAFMDERLLAPPLETDIADLILASNKSEKGLQRQIAQLSYRLRQGTESMCLIGKFANQNNQDFKHRAFISFRDNKIDTVQFGHLKQPNVVAFVFSGQGGQYPGMGAQLYLAFPEFKKCIDKCADLFNQYLAIDLREIMFNTASDAIHQTNYTQPALFAFEYALARLLIECQIVPDILIGHSIGEIVAATVSDAIELRDAVHLVYYRAHWMNNTRIKGKMLAVFAEQTQVQPIWENYAADLVVGSMNAPDNIVLSGTSDAIEKIQVEFEQNKIHSVLLKTSNAFHSPILNEVADQIREKIETTVFKAPKIPIISNVSGKVLEKYNTDYWITQMLSTVRFSDAIKTAQNEFHATTFVEVGPKNSLLRFIPTSMNCIALQNGTREDNVVSLGKAIGQLYLSGLKPQLQKLYGKNAAFYSIGRPVYQFDETTLTPDFLKKIPQRMAINNKAIAAKLPAQTNTLMELGSIYAQLLREKPENLDPTISFLEMGADSVILVGAIRQISNQYGLEISVKMLFEQIPNLYQLADYIDKNTQPVEVETEATLLPDANELAPLPAPLSKQQSGITQAFVPTTEPSFAPQASETLQNIINSQLDLMKMQLNLLQNSVSIGTEKHIPQNNGIQPTSHKTASPPLPTNKQKTKSFQSKEYIPPTASSSLGKNQNLSKKQATHLKRLIADFTAKTARSKKMTQAARGVLADSKASVGFKHFIKEMLYPIIGEKSEKGYVYDVDGNKYIDITMGFGVHLLGHKPPRIIKALENELFHGAELGPRSAKVGEVAALVSKLTGNERVVFTNSGTEAIMTAIRLVRAKSGKNKIVTFSSSYHGHSDTTLGIYNTLNPEGSLSLSAGIPKNVMKDLMVLKYDDPHSLQLIRKHANELAGVLVEPVQSRRPELQPKAFLKELRQLTHDLDIPLVFDEMVTGFRVAKGGIQELFGIKADLTTYGKIVGGGMPIGIVAGSKEFMDAIDGGFWQYGDHSYPAIETTFFGGTFCQHPMAIASAKETLTLLDENGNELLGWLNKRTNKLASVLNDFFETYNAPIRVVHFSSLFRFAYKGNMEVFFYYLMLNGIFVWEWRNFFLSAAHTDDDLNQLVYTIKKSVLAMQRAGFIDTRLDKHQEITFIHYFKNEFIDFLDTENEIGYSTELLVEPPVEKPLDKSPLSIYFFGNYPAAYNDQKYQILLNTAQFADKNHFQAFWLPERHFDQFGGFSPNPSVLAAALAVKTQNIDLRAGSLVLPLHHTVRAVEEWAVVDNLSKGRSGLAIASGWHPNDFVFNPTIFGKHRQRTFAQIVEFREIWKTRTFKAKTGKGELADLYIYPEPKQSDIPLWLTIVSNTETYRKAGELGVGVLTNLMGQSQDELQKNILLYHESLVKHGHDIRKAKVTVLVHTFLAENDDLAISMAKPYLKEYLTKTNLLISKGKNIDVSAADEEYIIAKAMNEYMKNKSLIGSVAICQEKINNWLGMGITEIALFLDFGIPDDYIVKTMPLLQQLNNSFIKHQPKVTHTSSLNAAQRQLLILDRLEKDASRAYYESYTLKVGGNLDEVALVKVMHQMMQRHEALRTVFKNDRQLILETMEPSVTLKDFSGGQTEEEVQRWKMEWDDAIFDLQNGPLWRVAIIKLAAQGYEILTTAHHILFDGFSIGVFLNDFKAFYEAITTGKAIDLAPATPFRDFIHFQHELLQTEAVQKQKTYWLTQLSKNIEPLNLPYQHLSGKRNEGKSFTIPFPADLFKQIKKIGIQQGCTISSTLAAVFSLLMSRITSQEEFILGMPMANRTTFGGGETMIGYCSHIAPLLFTVNPEDTFIMHVKKCQNLILDSFLQYQDYPFADLLEEVKDRYNSNNPLVNVTFNSERVILPQIDGLKLQIRPNEPRYVPFDLRVDLLETDKQILLSIGYNKSRLSAEFIEGLKKSFIGLCHQVTKKTEEPIKAIATVENPQVLLKLGQGEITQAPFVSIVDRFKFHVNTQPEKDALLNNLASVSYGALAEQSDAVAHYLMCQGVKKGNVIGVLMNRGKNFVSTALGILKVGAAYLPIDPALPSMRIQFMIDDSRASMVVTDLEIPTEVNSVPFAKWMRIIEQSPSNLQLPELSEKDLCYIIYTSGSTGKPKGVKIAHGALNNLIQWHVRQYKLDRSTIGFQLAAVSFDASVWELWPYLAVGATVSQFPAEKMIAPQAVIDKIKQHKVNIAFIPTALVKYLTNANWEGDHALRTILTGGDRLEKLALAHLPFNLYNNYGPTETTVVATFGQVDANDVRSPHIGKPVDNTAVRIVDYLGHVVQDGIPGEMLITGKGLAQGYTNETFTSECFITNNYGERSYKTGDRAYWDMEGNIHFVGRIDHQVQLRGLRIELGEIENALLEHKGITEAKAMILGGKEGKEELMAYVYTQHENISSKQLKIHLKKYLPAFMIPPTIKFTTAPFELNHNSKVDWKNLEKQTTRKEAATSSRPPKNKIEESLLGIWRKFLKNDSVTLDDDFFMVGGHSLIAVEIIDEVNRQFNLQLPISMLILHNTIESLATVIEHGDQKMNLIIPLNKKRPSYENSLVLFAPIGGNVLCYSKLAENLSATVYGVQSPFLSDTEIEIENFDRLVDYYVNEIKNHFVVIDQRLAIGGFCAGGLLALEVHRKIKSQFRNVGQLLLIDSSAPSEIPEENMHGEDIRYLLLDDFYKDLCVQNGKNVQHLSGVLKNLSVTDQIDYVREQAIKDQLLSEKISVEMFRKLFEAFYRNAMIISPYVPEQFEEHLILYRAEKIAANLQDIKEFHLRDLGWYLYNKGLTEVIDVPGDHNTMLNPENVTILAQSINQTLNKETCTLGN